MPAVHVRNVDDAVLDALKRRAASHNRSLEGELREVLREAAFQDATRPRGTRRRLKLHIVSVGGKASHGREEIYGDEGR